MRRIVSLVPSLTETVAKISGAGQLLGITKFCVHPSKLLRHSITVGGTKDPDLTLIARLNPTHILANLEENTPEVLATLSRNYPTLITKPSAISHVPDMLREMAHFLSDDVYQTAADELESLMRQIVKPVEVANAYYFIWKSPWMIAGEGTYIKDAMSWLGYNLIQPLPGRYPEIVIDHLDRACPMFFSTEPWAFRKRDLEEFPASILNPGLYYKIDGKVMSWYGSTTADLLRKILSHQRSKIYRPFIV